VASLLDTIKVIVIFRGIPGSGKSTECCKFRKFCHNNRIPCQICSADNYFENGEKYLFDKSKLAEAHDFCRDLCLKCMEKAVSVICIDNTNTTYKEMKPYLDLAKEYGYTWFLVDSGIQYASTDICHRRCVHNVPYNTIFSMANRYMSATKVIEEYLIDNYLHPLQNKGNLQT